MLVMNIPLFHAYSLHCPVTGSNWMLHEAMESGKKNTQSHTALRNPLYSCNAVQVLYCYIFDIAEIHDLFQV